MIYEENKCILTIPNPKEKHRRKVEVKGNKGESRDKQAKRVTFIHEVKILGYDRESDGIEISGL